MNTRKESIWHIQKGDADWVKKFPENSMYEYLKQTAQTHLNACAIEFEGNKISYKKLLQQIDVVASAFIASGIKKGDCISIVSINTPQIVVAIYAANKIGAVVNMIHPLLSTLEIKKFIQDTNSVAVVILDQLYPKIEKIIWDNGVNPQIILTRIVDALPLLIKPLYSIKAKTSITINAEHKCIYWNDFLNLAKSNSTVSKACEVNAEDVAMIMYSGGTTGIPKGVMLTNFNINSYGIIASEVINSANPVGKKFLAILPLFHGFGFGSGIHANLTQGVHVYLIPKFEFKKSVDLIFKKKINFMYSVPALYEAIIRSPHIENNDLSFFECLLCGGDKLPKRLYDKFSILLEQGNANTVFCEGYGQTESVACSIINPYFAVNSDSIGITVPDIEAKIVEIGTQNEVVNGQDGELCICGPTVMKGYFNNEEETAKALQVHSDGKTWLHTGDMVSKDDNGYFYFKQRISRMAISAGYNIYVTQMEKVIAECDEVLECCVVGIPDKVLGQKIRVYAVPANDSIGENELKEIIAKKSKESFAEYSQPHDIRIIKKLPMTHIGKVDIKLLESEK